MKTFGIFKMINGEEKLVDIIVVNEKPTPIGPFKMLLKQEQTAAASWGKTAKIKEVSLTIGNEVKRTWGV